MKKASCISILSVALFIQIAAQVDFRFADTTAVWNYEGKLLQQASPGGYYYFTNVLNIHGDTVINTTHYQRIFNSHVRKDSNERVYVLDFSGVNEILIYDFSLGKGDTFRIYNSIAQDTMNILVDSTDIINDYGTPKKRMFVRVDPIIYGSSGSDVFIEGIGSLYSYLFQPLTDDSQLDGSVFRLLCYSENGITYQFDNSCYVGINEYLPDDVQVEIIALQTFISLSLTGMDNSFSFTLFDISGRKILQQPVNTGINTISTESIGKGIYIWTIDTSPNILTKGKIVIH